MYLSNFAVDVVVVVVVVVFVFVVLVGFAVHTLANFCTFVMVGGMRERATETNELSLVCVCVLTKREKMSKNDGE